MRCRLAILLALAACAMAPAAAPAASKHVVHAANAGAVHAELSYDHDEGGDPPFANFRLKIARAGAAVLDAPVKAGCSGCALRPAGDDAGGSLTAPDLDGDGEPEVVLDLYTGGAHCCTLSVIHSFDPARGAYSSFRHSWGNTGYVVSDLDDDGRLELRSSDDRFSYRFAAYSLSVRPLQVWRLRGGRLVDVTRRFEPQLRRDARRLYRLYGKVRSDSAAVRGVLAAYVAERFLAGQGRRASRDLRTALRRGELRRARYDGWLGGRAYVRDLRGFLKRTGYIR